MLKRTAIDAVDVDRLDRIEATMARLEAKLDALSSATRSPCDDPER